MRPYRPLPALLLVLAALGGLAALAALPGCESAPQLGPRLGDLGVPGSVAGALSVKLETNRTDLSADGASAARIQATVTDGAGRPVAGQSVFFLLATRGYTGAAGTLSEESAKTDAKGQAVVSYTAPQLGYVPPESAVVVTAMLAEPGAAFAPSAMVAILLAPKGTPTPAGGGNGGPTPTPVPPPKITALLPDRGPVGEMTTVVVLGESFQAGATVTFVSNRINPPHVAIPSESAEGRLVVDAPVVEASQAGEVSVFVTNPDGKVSEPVVFTFTTSTLGKPEIETVEPPAPSNSCSSCTAPCPDCTYEGWQMLILGKNFDRCASILIVHNGVIHELLPSPDGSHQSSGSVACELDGLPAECTEARPDLVPWPHDEIVNAGGATCEPYRPGDAGAFVWVDSGQLRLLYGPRETVGCPSTDQARLYVSNKPGSGVGAEETSAAFPIVFTCGMQ